MKGSQGRNTSYEPRGKNWSRCHGGFHLAVLLPMAFSVCFCTQPRANDPPRGGSTYIALGLATSINNQEIAYRSIWWGHFLNLGSLFQDDPVLCLLNKEQSESPCIKKIKIGSDNSKLPLLIYPPVWKEVRFTTVWFFFPLKSPESAGLVYMSLLIGQKIPWFCSEWVQVSFLAWADIEVYERMAVLL